MRPAGGDLGAVPYRRHRAPPRPGRGRFPPRPRLVRVRATRLRAPCRAAHVGGDPDLHDAVVPPHDRYQLHVEGSEHALATLAEAGVLDDDHRPLDRPPGRVVARPCCRGAYLRGAFLGGGSLTGPRSPHLEVRTPTPAGASFLRSVGSAEEVRLRVSERTSHARAYAKGWEEIEGYLLAAGVVDAVLALEERSVIAEMRAEANRLANADHANLVRTARAAQRQLDAARGLRASGALEALPEPLREAAALRLRHPALSLRELAERASPPTTKASMQRRLAKVVELGEK